MVQLWAKSDDESIEYISLTPEYLDDALKLLNDAFFKHENVCKALGLGKHPEAMAELEELTMRTVRDGVSVIAVDKSKNKVVGAAFNKIQVKPSSTGESYFETYAKACKYGPSRAVVQFMIDADARCDLFDLCKTDCLLELMFLATSPEYRGKGIGKQLCQSTIDLTTKLLHGENVKVGLDGGVMELKPVPTLVSAIYSTFISQRIGRQCGFQVAATMSYEDFKTEDGKTFASLIDPRTPNATLEYRLLQ